MSRAIVGRRVAARHRSARAVGFVVAVSFALTAGCDDNGSGDVSDDGSAGADVRDVENDTTSADAFGDVADEVVESTDASAEMDTTGDDVVPLDAEREDAQVEMPRLCDPLQPSRCALPYPSNLYLEPDPTRETGYTLRFGSRSLPPSVRGDHPDPSHYRRLDGYGVGTSIVVHFPNIDVTSLPGELEVAASMDPDAAVLLFEETRSGLARVPYWAELDQRNLDPAVRVLWIRPAVILREETRYIVAFRSLRTGDGELIEASPAFAALRDRGAASDPQLAARVESFERVFADLDSVGVAREELVLAWDFVTASCDSLHGDMTAIREQAFAAVGELGPELVIDEVTAFAADDDGTGRPVDAEIAYRVRGTARMPDFMIHESDAGQEGFAIHRGADGRPTQSGWRDAPFWAMIPRADGDEPLDLMQYGHGLLGSGSQVWGSHNRRIAHRHGVVFFSSDLTGFAEADVPIVAGALTQLSHIDWFLDRIHQGIVEYLLLGRAFRARFAELPEIAALDVTIDDDELLYSGISQGGIYGATYMALTQDVRHGHLGVPGQNYTLLLQRSIDFDPYFEWVRTFYSDPPGQAILQNVVGSLWETTDPVSYYRHIAADPFEGHEARSVLLAQAKGDWQVSNLTNEIVARSDLGVALMVGYGRPVDLVAPTSYPHVGSALVNYDFGDPWSPLGNVAPPTGPGGDPHGKPKRADHHNDQMMHFLRTGEVIDVCGGDGCTPD